MRTHSDKTGRANLRPVQLYLEQDGGEFVIATNDRSSATNLRTVFDLHSEN